MKAISVFAVVSALSISLPSVGMPLQLVLRLQERVSMSTLARNVQDPTSARFRKFYTPEEIRSIAAPTDADYATLLNNLKSQHVTVVQESPSHLFLTVQAETSVIENLFQVKLVSINAKTHTFKGQVHMTHGLGAIASVSGLDNQRHVHPMFQRTPADFGLGGGVDVPTIRKLYGFDAIYKQGITGAGQHLAIATYDDFDVSDSASYFKQFSISPVPTVDKVPVGGTPKPNDNTAMETDTDIELSGSIAPGASIHVFSSATNDDPGEVKLFTAILDDNRAKVANYSYGGCEQDVTAEHKADMNTIFERAVAQGVNIMVASGDSGTACPQGDAQGNITGYVDPGADWPAAHPSIVAVGGTKIDPKASQLQEVAWSGKGKAGGSGGGMSLVWNLPTWQSDIGAQFTKRSYPDIAFNADPASGQTVLIKEFGFPFPMSIGGTSIAAPQWSGFMILVGQARAKANLPQLGFLNPILYAMSASDKASTLNDVTDGNNGDFSAGKGWDAVTGWGSLHASSLFTYLTTH